MPVQTHEFQKLTKDNSGGLSTKVQLGLTEVVRDLGLLVRRFATIFQMNKVNEFFQQ